eukprot:9485346-Pyramimonas_sp.AAC.1
MCKATKVNTVYGRCEVDPHGAELQICNLFRHASRPQHVSACASVNGLPTPPQTPELNRADFERVLELRRQGGPLRQIELTLAMEGKGRKKVMRLQYAIAEAMRFQAREHLAKCSSICLCQDGSGHNLITRCAGADKHMNIYKGVLGIGNHVKAGSGAEGLATCTKQVRWLSLAARPPRHQTFLSSLVSSGMRGPSQALRVGPEWALRPHSAHSSIHGSPHREGAQIVE